MPLTPSSKKRKIKQTPKVVNRKERDKIEQEFANFRTIFETKFREQFNNENFFGFLYVKMMKEDFGQSYETVIGEVVFKELSEPIQQMKCSDEIKQKIYNILKKLNEAIGDNLFKKLENL